MNTITYCACGAHDCDLQMSVDWPPQAPGHVVVVVFAAYGDACREEFPYTEFLANLERWRLAGHVYSLPTMVGSVQTFLIAPAFLDRFVAITKEQANVHGITL